MDSLTKLYCLIDDFCREFEPEWERYLLKDEMARAILMQSTKLCYLST